jgi:CRP/FNR family transcriptional regulator, cyclic AMP receptor protein
MPSMSVFDHVATHPFLAGLPDHWQQRLAVHASPVMRHSGQRLFREGGRADRFWLLQSGDVALDFHVAGRGDVVIEHIGPGGALGWSWLFAPRRWTLGGIVAQDCRALQFDAVAVQALVDDDPVLGRELVMRFAAVMAERLQAARRRLLELYAYPSDLPGWSDPASRDQ